MKGMMILFQKIQIKYVKKVQMNKKNIIKLEMELKLELKMEKYLVKIDLNIYKL